LPPAATVPDSLRLPLIVSCRPVLPLTLVNWLRLLYADVVKVVLICSPVLFPAGSYR
jgi:hypothetical protein